MAGNYTIRITPRALADLEGAFDYIQCHSPRSAAKVVSNVLEAIDGLDMMPYRYNVPRTGSVRGRQIRSMPVGNYLVRHRIDERKKAVHVLRVRHGPRRRP